VVYDIDETLLHTRVPPMLLQPIVENAVKHGIAPKVEGGTITVSVQRHNQYAHIRISDTGLGYDGPLDKTLFEKGIGLRNTNMRLEKLYGQSIQVSRNIPGGLIFSFDIPLPA
jgi:two-component system, LytTR family, sensor kinase